MTLSTIDFYHWSVANRMSFDLEKCAKLSIRNVCNETCSFDGFSLKRTSQEKVLGEILALTLVGSPFEAKSLKGLNVLLMLRNNIALFKL